MDIAAEAQDALARRDKRAALQKLDMYARTVLRAAGWDADESRLRDAALRHTKEASNDVLRVGKANVTGVAFPAAMVDEVMARAIALRNDPAVVGRRLNAEEIIHVSAKYIDGGKRAEIRTWIRQHRTEHPDATSPNVRPLVNETFGVNISAENFWATYWRAADPNVAATSKAVREKAAPTEKPGVTLSPITRHKTPPAPQMKKTARAVQNPFVEPGTATLRTNVVSTDATIIRSDGRTIVIAAVKFESEVHTLGDAVREMMTVLQAQLAEA